MTNDKQKRKELAKEYVQTHRLMGVYQIKNKVNGKIFVASSLDVPGMFNRHRFMLEMGGHANRELAEDWKKVGAEQFSFDILEQIKPREEILQSPGDLDKYKSELAIMEKLWLDELQPYGERGYNKLR